MIVAPSFEVTVGADGPVESPLLLLLLLPPTAGIGSVDPWAGPLTPSSHRMGCEMNAVTGIGVYGMVWDGMRRREWSEQNRGNMSLARMDQRLSEPK